MIASSFYLMILHALRQPFLLLVVLLFSPQEGYGFLTRCRSPHHVVPFNNQLVLRHVSTSARSSDQDPMAAYEQARGTFFNSTTTTVSSRSVNGRAKPIATATKKEKKEKPADNVVSNGTTSKEKEKDSTSSSSTSTSSSSTTTTTTSPNLYEILGASPEDSKAELKRKYVVLAKQTHPDALSRNGNNGASSSTSTTDRYEFSEIAAAYKILSDPKQKKRYDRKIKAEAFSREISEFAGDVAEKTAPRVRDILDTVAMPFLRRTTATTLASIQAAAKEIDATNKRQNNNNNKNDGKVGDSSTSTSTSAADVGGVFVSAMKAAQKAGRIVDNLELMEKSEVLESQVLDQIDEANKIKEQLDETTLRRIIAALRTPSASFSASDAARVLQACNISTTFLERAKIKSTVDRKIQDLQTAEEAMSDKDVELEAALMLYRDWESNLQQARADRVLALQAEKRAREALVVAQREVAESKLRLINTTKSLSQAEVAMERIAMDRERMANLLARQQEDVRKSMLNRREISGELMKDDNDKDSNDENNDERADNLTQLAEQEAALIKEYSRLEVAASQLQSKANKLRDRAEQLKSMQ